MCVFDLPRTCGSPTPRVLLLMTRVGKTSAVRLVPKAPSGMAYNLPTAAESTACVCLPDMDI